jgi:hypothetical protein
MVKDKQRYIIEIKRQAQNINYKAEDNTGDIAFINASTVTTSYVQSLPIPPGGSLSVTANNDERTSARFDININGNTDFYIIEKKFIND